MSFFGIVVVTCIALALVFALLIRRLLLRSGEIEADVAWLEDFSLDAYRPMERLLQEDDYRFLASQPGYRPQIARRLRTERRRIFRLYLAEMLRDFNRLVRLANFAIVCGGEDRPDASRELNRVRFQFYWAVFATQCSLTLQPLGLRAAPQALTTALASMESNLRMFSARPGVELQPLQ